MIKLTDIILTEQRKPGDIWNTGGGKFASINRAYPTYTRYFDTEEKARAYATSRIKKAKVNDEPTQEPNSKRSDLIKQRLDKDRKRKKARLTALANKKDKPKKKDDEDMEILHQLQKQQQNEPEKDDDFKFGGGGGFSGGGSSGKF